MLDQIEHGPSCCASLLTGRAQVLQDFYYGHTDMKPDLVLDHSFIHDKRTFNGQ